MQTPLVSIIVATYRRDMELQRALESLANLSYTNYEVIVVDDNAESNWNIKVKALIDKFSNEMDIRLIVNYPNKGSALTRNIGIEEANGEYICFLDDDDLYLSDRIQNQLYSMMKVNADFSVTDLALYSETEKLIEIRTRNYIKDTSKDSLLRYHLMHHITGTDTMMFRKDYLEKIGGFEAIDVGDEFYLMHKAIIRGGIFLYVPGCDIKAYIHTGETGLSSGTSKITGEKQLYEFKKQFFGELDKSVIRYIKMRHHMVLAYAELRNGKFVMFSRDFIWAFCWAPLNCLKMILSRK